MRRILTGIILCFAVATAGFTQEAVPADPIARAFLSMNAGQFDAALVQAEDISNPAAKLFVQASIAQAKGEPERAIEIVTRGIAQYPNDPDWTAKSELMSAALYVRLGMLDAAAATVRQMQLFYEGTDTAAKAAVLQERIEKMKADKESEGSKQ